MSFSNYYYVEDVNIATTGLVSVSVGLHCSDPSLVPRNRRIILNLQPKTHNKILIIKKKTTPKTSFCALARGHRCVTEHALK